MSSWTKPPTCSDVLVPGTMNDRGNEPAPDSGAEGAGAWACAPDTPTSSATAAVRLPSAPAVAYLRFLIIRYPQKENRGARQKRHIYRSGIQSESQSQASLDGMQTDI